VLAQGVLDDFRFTLVRSGKDGDRLRGIAGAIDRNALRIGIRSIDDGLGTDDETEATPAGTRVAVQGTSKKTSSKLAWMRAGSEAA
jgi:hypothetical protein